MTTATQRFEALYLNAIKSVCILEEQLELLTEMNKTQELLTTRQAKEIARLEKKLKKTPSK